jgi:DNA polymerase-3 subunit delta'
MKKTLSKKDKKSTPLQASLSISKPPSPLITVGHKTQRTFFEHLIERNRLPSTILLAGPGGIGKRRIAQEMAQSLFCEKHVWAGCGTCHSCTLFKAHNTPDLYQLDFADAEQASIERVRELLYSLQLKSFAGTQRVVIFDNAHLMSNAVTNVLLKTLEEPRPNTYFLLISSSKARMLPTLLSRSQVVHFSHLNRNEIDEILNTTPSLINTSINSEQRELLIDLTDGSLEGLATMSDDLPLAQSLSERIDAIVKGEAADVTKLASELGKDKDKLPQTFRLLTVLLRSKIYKALDSRTKSVFAYALQNCISCERLALERNLSAHYLFTTLFAQLTPLTEFREPILIENVVV